MPSAKKPIVTVPVKNENRQLNTVRQKNQAQVCPEKLPAADGSILSYQ